MEHRPDAFSDERSWTRSRMASDRLDQMEVLRKMALAEQLAKREMAVAGALEDIRRRSEEQVMFRLKALQEERAQEELLIEQQHRDTALIMERNRMMQQLLRQQQQEELRLRQQQQQQEELRLRQQQQQQQEELRLRQQQQQQEELRLRQQQEQQQQQQQQEEELRLRQQQQQQEELRLRELQRQQEELQRQQQQQQQEELQERLQRQQEEDEERQRRHQELEGQGQQVSPPESTFQGSESSLLRRQELASWKGEFLSRVKEMAHQKSLYVPAVNAPVNAISPVSAEYLADKLDRLQRVLEHGVPAATYHPLARDYLKSLLAQKFFDHGKVEVSSKPKSAFAIAAVLANLWSDFPDLGQLFLAMVWEACPYLVPCRPLPKSSEGPPDKDDYLRMGYLYDSEGNVESQPKYLERISGITRLYAAVAVSPLSRTRRDAGKDHPHGMGNLWRLLAATVNGEPVNDVTATIIFDLLEVAGSEMAAKYGGHFFRLLAAIRDDFCPLIKAATVDGSGGPLMRLDSLLKSSIASNSVKSPDGALPADYI